MAVKEWFRRLQPVQLYLVLFFTTAFFIVEIIASHVTHSLTLLLNGYHMLCNIVALIGCIASVKYAHRKNCNGGSRCSDSSICMNEDEKGSAASVPSKPKQSCSDRRMKNTFGWARIDILTMLVCCVLLASFCFSLLVEALQTLVHIDHLDEMHHALPVICIGISGILLNGCCYVIIGGYTFNQGIFLHVTKEGNIILQRNVRSERGAVEGEQKLAPVPNRTSPLALPRRPAYREMLRDVLGCFLVVIASIIVYFTDAHLAKFIDPIFAIISAISLFVLSYPYMRESGLILLQTIPNHINIDSLKKELLAAFPGIVNVHDLHVWHLAGEKVICTAHIIFLDPMVYTSITDQVTDFFVDIGITQVTIQPEFHKMKPNAEKSPCLIRCQGKRCKESQCCSKEGSTTEDHATEHGHLIHKKSAKKELLPAPLVVDLKKFNLNKSDSARSVDEVGCIQNSSRSLSDPRNPRCPKNSIFAIDVEIVEANVNDPVHEDTIIYENLDEHCAAETVQTDR